MDLDDFARGRPFLTQGQVSKLVQESFNRCVKSVTPLTGYDDQNFMIEVDVADSEGATTYVLKVTNSTASEAFQQIVCASQIMVFLKEEGFHCPCPVPDKNGNLLKLLTFNNLTLPESGGDGVALNRSLEDTFVVRMLTFIPGVTLNDLPDVPYHIFEDMGETLGRIHVALKRLKIDLGPLKDWSNEHPWSLKLIRNIIDVVAVIKQPQRNKICRESVDAFERNVLGIIEQLPQGLLHGDFNDSNILVNDPSEGESDSMHITGFVDFEHCHYSCLVFDVGISFMYLLQCNVQEPNKAAKLFLRGYQKRRKMTRLEKSCLFYCVAARFVQSLVIGTKVTDERTDGYMVTTSAHKAWMAFEEMWVSGREESYKKWGFS